MNRPKDGLALSGGRARGLAHSGVLKVFKRLPEERLRDARQG
jgi:predicted acylesterase/phospholipase RssA